ncbi:unnamed protein product, partial [Dibothriocephalus latus]
FLRRWVLEGRCDDPFNEFSIIINHRFDDHADISFWKHFVSLRSLSRDQSEDGLPALRRPHRTAYTSAFYGLLPSSFESSVLRCGLSLTLLRKIEPKHFIFNQSSNFPQLGLWNHADGWDAIQSGLVAYEQGVNSALYQSRFAWFQTLVQKENEKRYVLAQVRLLPNVAFARDEETSRHLLLAEHVGKGETLTDLKEDAQENMAQLATEEENLKMADQRYTEEAHGHTFTEPRPLAEAPTNIANTDAHSITIATNSSPKPPLSPRPIKSPLGSSGLPSPLKPSPPPPFENQMTTMVASSEGCISEFDLLAELKQQFRLRSTRGRPPPDRIGDIIQPGVIMQLEADTSEGNKENDAHLQESSSARVVTSPVLSRAKQILYGPGLGPTCRQNTWRKPENVEHLSDEEILAFTNEMLEPPPSPPPFPSLENCETDFGWFFCFILLLSCFGLSLHVYDPI